MKKMIVLFCFFVAGCATEPFPLLKDYKVMPGSSIEKYGSTEETANAVITRDAGYAGSAADFFVFVNSEKIMKIEQGSKAYLKLPVGKHIFGLCVTMVANSKQPDFEFETEISDTLSVYRVSVEPYQPPRFSKTSLIK